MARQITSDTSTNLDKAQRGGIRTSPRADAAYNQYAVHGIIAKNVLAHFKMNAKLAPTCDRKFQSEWANDMDDHGDTITFRRMQTYGVQTGLQAWNPQPMQEELITLTVSDPKGIQTEEEWNTAGIYRNEAYANASKIAEVENLAYEIDNDIAEKMAGNDGYTQAVMPLQRLTATGEYALAPAGLDQGQFGTFPRNRLFTYTKAEMASRGVQNQTLHACVDHFTSASLGDTALFGTYFAQGAAPAQAQSQGNLDGQMVGGWKITDSTLNGTQAVGRVRGHIQVHTAPTIPGVTDNVNLAGQGTVRVKGSVAGDVIRAGTRVQFDGCGAVNTRTKRATQGLASYICTADVTLTTAGTSYNMSIFPPMQNGNPPSGNTVTHAYRRRNCTAAPLQNATVWVNGVDTGDTDIAKASGGPLEANQTLARSLLVAQDSTIMVFALPYVDPKGPVPVSKMELKDSKVAYCVAVDQELKGHKTYYEVWSRIGLAVGEWEAGFIATGGRMPTA